MENLTLFLKQLGAWATDLTDNYRYNPFFKATVHIIIILVVLTVLVVTISGWAIQYAQNNTVGSINYHIQQAVQGSPTAVSSLPQAINNVRNRTLGYAFVCLVILVALFGMLLVRFALSPGRNSLQIQKRFIGNVAHEIRTPLAIIKTTTEVALMDSQLSPNLKEAMESTIVELNRISDTINNLLSFDMLMQPGRMKMEPINMCTLAETVIGRHQALAESRGVKLTLASCSRNIVLGNPTALEQVLTNLVKNAINYTPAHQNGSVHVSIENDYRHRVVIAVIDNGAGIAQKDLYHVFEPFYRGDTSRARGMGTGTSGLGLAIVNEITRMHRGTISIKSAIGHGTTVAISLPPAEITIPLLPSDEDHEHGIHEVSLDFS